MHPVLVVVTLDVKPCDAQYALTTRCTYPILDNHAPVRVVGQQCFLLLLVPRATDAYGFILAHIDSQPLLVAPTYRLGSVCVTSDGHDVLEVSKCSRIAA